MKLFKLLFKLILLVIILVAIILGITIYTISDKTNEVNLEYYNDVEITTNDVLKPIVKDGFDNMGTNYALNVSFDEASLNKLLFSIIRSKLNTKYDPVNGTTDEEKYLNSQYGVPEGIPVVGGKKVIIDSCYAQFEDTELYLNVTANALGIIKTRLRIGLSIETKENEYVFNITSLRLGKFDLQKGIGKKIYNAVIKSGAINEKDINEKLKDLPFTLDLAELALVSDKQELGEYLTDVVAKQTSEGGELSPVVVAFLGIVTNADNKMLNLNTKNKQMLLNIDLIKLKDEKLTVSDEVKIPFSYESFAETKTQTIAMGLLAGGSENSIIFNDMEISRLLYTQTEGYKDLGFETKILDDIDFKVGVYGLLFDITKNTFNIEIYLDVNGLKTKGVLSCPISYSDAAKSKALVKLPSTFKLGQLDVEADFINNLLKETMAGEDSILKFEDKADGSYLVIDKEIIFDKFIASAGSTADKLTIDRIEFIDGALAIYVGIDPSLQALLDDATSALSDALESIDLSAVDFDTTDPAQAAAITELTSTVSELSSIISDPSKELTSEDTNNLIESYNNLSPENQEAFINSLQNEYTPEQAEKFEDLYAQLFGSSAE